MPKMKTHKGSAKRFRRTGTGKIMRAKALRATFLPRSPRSVSVASVKKLFFPLAMQQ